VPVCVIAIASGLQGWPWTIHLTTIINVSIDREKQIKGATLPVIYSFLIFWNYSLLYGKILELSEL